MATIKEIYNLSVDERADNYNAEGITSITIDGNEFTGYKAFSFIWEKTFAKEPERSSSGVIGNLDSYPTFITPHLKIDFSMISIDDYRRLYNLILNRNEFDVTCYDVVNNCMTTNKMYFAPDQFPKLFTMARHLSQGGKFIELTGVRDYTVELIGTNNTKDEVSVSYVNENTRTRSIVQESAGDVFVGDEIIIGQGSTIPQNPPYGYYFSHWLGSDGVVYYNGAVVKINPAMKNGLTLTAQWRAI
jgi:hypothetical protein